MGWGIELVRGWSNGMLCPLFNLMSTIPCDKGEYV